MRMQDMKEIYENYSKQVYKYLFCLTHNDNLSEELTQETFYIAVKEIKKFRGECKLYVWLCQIAKNLWYKELKKEKLNTISIDNLDEDVIYSNKVLEDECISKIYLHNKIENLDERTQEIIKLRVIGNFNFKEISEIMNISENLARVNFYRGKQKIKESGDEYGKK